MKVKIENKKIVAVNKKIDYKIADGNFVGMAKFSKNVLKSYNLLFTKIHVQNFHESSWAAGVPSE